MLEKLKKNWAQLKASKPGERFQQYYRRRHDPDRATWQRVAMLAGGVVLLLVGLFLMPAPGPGIIVVAGAAALLATESRLTARALDATETGLRSAWARVRGAKTKTPRRAGRRKRA